MGTMCLSGAALFKAGANVSTALTEAQYDYAILQAESSINVATRYNWTDGYAALNADVKYILEDVCSNLAAMYLVSYDMSGYTSRVEAEDMVNVHIFRIAQIHKLLKDASVQDFLSV